MPNIFEHADSMGRITMRIDFDQGVIILPRWGHFLPHIPGQSAYNEGKQMSSPILKHFDFEHLPAHLQAVSAPIGELARHMDDVLPDGPEKSAGLRKLLEAKDCLVRARLEKRS